MKEILNERLHRVTEASGTEGSQDVTSGTSISSLNCAATVFLAAIHWTFKQTQQITYNCFAGYILLKKYSVCL